MKRMVNVTLILRISEDIERYYNSLVNNPLAMRLFSLAHAKNKSCGIFARSAV